MYKIDFSHDDDVTIKNKLFNNIQTIRADIVIMMAKKIAVDDDVVHVAQALARDIERLRKKV